MRRRHEVAQLSGNRQVIAVNICVIRQNCDDNRGILICDHAVIHRHRRVVHRRDSDADRRCRSDAIKVTHHISEGVRPVVVRRRCIGDAGIADQHDGTMRRLARLDNTEGTLHIGVIRQHVDEHRSVLRRRRAVIHRHRRIVHRRHDDNQVCPVCASVSVAHIVEAPVVRAGPVCLRVVGESAVTVIAHGAGRSAMHPKPIEAERVSSVHIRVIVQYPNKYRRVLWSRNYVISRHRRVVDRSDIDRHCRHIGIIFSVIDLEGEGVSAVCIWVGCICECSSERIGDDRRAQSSIGNDAVHHRVVLRVIRRQGTACCNILIRRN